MSGVVPPPSVVPLHAGGGGGNGGFIRLQPKHARAFCIDVHADADADADTNADADQATDLSRWILKKHSKSGVRARFAPN